MGRIIERTIADIERQITASFRQIFLETQSCADHRAAQERLQT